jgi:hypothetical protein
VRKWTYIKPSSDNCAENSPNSNDGSLQARVRVAEEHAGCLVTCL